MQKGVNCSSRIAQRALFTPLKACKSVGGFYTPVRETEQPSQTPGASRGHCRGAVITSPLMPYSLANLFQALLPEDRSPLSSLTPAGYTLSNLQSRQGQHQELSCQCVRDSCLPVSGVRTRASLDSDRDPVLTGRSNVRHIKGILPVVYKQRVMDISTKTASEIMFATGNANKLREVHPANLTAQDISPPIFLAGRCCCASRRWEGCKRKCPPAQVVAILEAGRPLPFTVKAANLDLPELQGEPQEIAREKCRLAAQQVKRPQDKPPLMSHALRWPASSETASRLRASSCACLLMT